MLQDTSTITLKRMPITVGQWGGGEEIQPVEATTTLKSPVITMDTTGGTKAGKTDPANHTKAGHQTNTIRPLLRVMVDMVSMEMRSSMMSKDAEPELAVRRTLERRFLVQGARRNAAWKPSMPNKRKRLTFFTDWCFWRGCRPVAACRRLMPTFGASR